MTNIILKITLSFLMLVQVSYAKNESEPQLPTDNPNVGTWTKLLTNSPSMRANNAMAYDIFHKKIINYGILCFPLVGSFRK